MRPLLCDSVGETFPASRWLNTQTLREPPSEAEVTSHRLLLRAGFIRQLAAGIFSLMPLGKRAATKIEGILREEINRIGGQELAMPVIHPSDIWKETGRWYQIGSEMGRFNDKNGREMALAMTHEEVVADLTRREIHSYRQLLLHLCLQLPLCRGRRRSL